jgi:hypothetical protein
MRALAGPAMLLVIAGGIGLYRYNSAPTAPPRDFLDLEFAGNEDLGSCYSLSTVIVANMIFNSSVMKWERDGDDTWVLSLDEVQDSGRGPVLVYQHYTFRQQGDRAHLVFIDASEGQNTDLAANIDALLQAPNERRSTPVDRCKDPDAEGYHFRRRKRA